jgi:oligoribonuclease NrnB/cAMP/cGMP phosphodiesterase (DHH superfamily)
MVSTATCIGPSFSRPDLTSLGFFFERIDLDPSMINCYTKSFKEKSMNKPLVIYHGNCADGFGSAWCFHFKDALGYDFHPGVYQQTPPDVADRDVFLVDFSYKRPVVEQMLTQARSITLIDHHKTAIDDLKPLLDTGSVKGITDVTHSGAMLTWQYLFGSEPAPQLLRHIEDRDLWRFALPHTREIQANLFSYEYDFAVWDSLMSESALDLVAGGTAITRKLTKDIHELLPLSTRKMRIGGHEVYVANMPYTMSSEAAMILAKDQPFAACYYDGPEYRMFSLRSHEGGLDVGEIAAQYGGGGHRNASGFRYALKQAHELEL